MQSMHADSSDQNPDCWLFLGFAPGTSVRNGCSMNLPEVKGSGDMLKPRTQPALPTRLSTGSRESAEGASFRACTKLMQGQVSKSEP